MTTATALPSHWTYEAISPEDQDLQQGDIIQPTEQLNAELGKVHPHFQDDKYSGFLILSQTCDLVRRAPLKQCKTNYINLAVIRPIQDVLIPLLDRYCSEDRFASGLYKKSARGQARMLMERLVNQNEQGMGLFYLHPDTEVQIPDHSIALLQVSFALKADSHYDMLLAARSGRLKHEFQCKLGWLIGNLYSRIATRDWPETERDLLVKYFLESPHPEESQLKWVDANTAKKMVAEARQPLDQLQPDVINELITKLAPVPAKDAALKRIAEIAAQMEPPIDPQTIERLQFRLGNDMEFNSIFK